MVGRRIIAEVGPSTRETDNDDEVIGIAAIERQRQQAIEEAQLRQACINSMDDSLQAEADSYLAEVDAEVEAERVSREGGGAEESAPIPKVQGHPPDEESDEEMDQS